MNEEFTDCRIARIASRVAHGEARVLAPSSLEVVRTARSLTSSVTFDKLDEKEALRIAWRINCMLADEYEMLGFDGGGAPTFDMVSAINDDGTFDFTLNLWKEFFRRSGIVAAANIQIIYDLNFGRKKEAKQSDEEYARVPGLLVLILQNINYALVKRIETRWMDDSLLEMVRSLVGAEARWYPDAQGTMFTVEAVLYGPAAKSVDESGFTEYGRHVFSLRYEEVEDAKAMAEKLYKGFFPDSDYRVEYEVTERIT